jgi:putative ABC transport system permease protein
MSFDDIKESALIAVDTLRANKVRSALTVLGVGIGVVTVIFMVSIIQGLNRSFAEQIEALGSNTIFATRFDPGFKRAPSAEERQRKDLTVEDADAIRREATTLVSVSPLRRVLQSTVRYRDRQTDTPALAGVTPFYEETHSSYVGRGRFIVETDLQERANVVVLGTDVVQALFPFEEPLDAEVRINGTPFRVVGVMEQQGNFFGQSRDNLVYIPLTSFDKYHPDPFMPGTIIAARPRTRAEVRMAVDEMTDILRRRRHVPPGAPNNFGVSTQDSLLDFYNQLTGATALVLTAVSFVALMIGGIGVMNIMLVSVTERTREIGVRKAVGATRANILWQFLIEAVVLTSIGGIGGLILGEASSLLMNRFSPLPAYVPMWAILIGVGISAGVGLIFGLWPAWKAARLDPIEALRYE